MEHIEKGVLHLSDPLYPKAVKQILSKSAPKTIYYVGNLSLLNKSGVGFCGSRKSSDKGLDTTKDCSQQVSTHGYVVISGNAAGVDAAAHYTALKNGGCTIFVLPEGINHFRVKKIFKDVWDWSKVLVLSQFQPQEPWKSYRAMTRNELIIALSKAMVVIEAGETGGTLAAGKSTLKLRVPLFVAQYENEQHTPGNSILLEMGGCRLMKNGSTMRANLNKLFDKVENDQIIINPQNCQTSLFQTN